MLGDNVKAIDSTITLATPPDLQVSAVTAQDHVLAGQNMTVNYRVANTGGTYSYTPAKDYNGADSFTYKVNDGTLDSNIVIVNLTVTPVNDAPVLTGRNAVTAEDTALILELRNTATDVDNSTLTPIIVTQPAHGTLVKNTDGTYSYTPASNYNGTDSFTYKVNDGSLDSNEVTVSLTVTAVNDAPVLTGRNASTAEDTALILELRNTATDVDSTTLTPVIVTQPAHGTLVKNTDGRYTYRPAKDYNGTDSFTYKVNDGLLNSNTVTVNLTVTPVNDAPVLTGRNVSTAEDAQLVLELRNTAADVDSATLTPVIVTQPAHGTLVKNTDGTYSYTPASNFNGADIFSYKVNDGQLNSNTVVVNLTVTPVNDAPVLNALAPQQLDEDTSLTLNLLAGGNDVDADALTVVIVTQPAQGTLVQNADGTYTYTPASNYNGADSFTYKVNDGTLDSNEVTVNLTVTPVNDAPVLNAITDQSVKEGTTLRVKLTAYDLDVGDTLTYSLVSAPAGASIDLVTKEVVWANPTGPRVVNFIVKVTDASGASFSRSFNVAVQDVPPSLTVTGSATAKVGTAFTLNLGASSASDDKVAGWTVDWGDGIVEVLNTNPANVKHNYMAPGNFTVRASARDQDGNYAASPLLVKVAQLTDIELRTLKVTLPAGSTLGTSGVGLPILLDSAYPLKAISFMMNFDPTVVKFTGVVAGANLPADAQIDYVIEANGLVRVTINCRSQNIAAGQGLELIKLKGSVLSNATPGKTSVLDLTIANVTGLMGQSYSDKLSAIDGALKVGTV